MTNGMKSLDTESMTTGTAAESLSFGAASAGWNRLAWNATPGRSMS